MGEIEGDVGAEEKPGVAKGASSLRFGKRERGDHDRQRGDPCLKKKKSDSKASKVVLKGEGGKRRPTTQFRQPVPEKKPG